MSYTHNSIADKKDAALEAKETLLDKLSDTYRSVRSEKTIAAAGLGAFMAAACDDDDDNGSKPVPVPDLGPGWKDEFTLDPAYLFMNVGTMGAMPKRVVEKLPAWHEAIAFGPLMAYPDVSVAARKATAPSFGCSDKELGFSLNTTYGVAQIVNSLKWAAGDGIITTDYEHSGILGPLSMLKNRFKAQVTSIPMPSGVSDGPNTGGYSDEEVMSRYATALTKLTKPKAIMFSSPLYKNGTRMPEKKICDWAASKNLLTILDGAHLPGTCKINLHDMGCDFFSSAGHKWQCGPGQSGIIYIRNGKKGDASDFPYANPNALPAYYPSGENYVHMPTSIGYNGSRSIDQDIATNFMSVGNINGPMTRALGECCLMWDEIGRDKIEYYVVGLAQYLRALVADRYGILAMCSDSRTNLKASDKDFPNYLKSGISNFNPFKTTGKVDYNADRTAEQYTAEAASVAKVTKHLDSKKVIYRLMWNLTQSRKDPTKMTEQPSASFRISTHLFHTTGDVEKFMTYLNEGMAL